MSTFLADIESLLAGPAPHRWATPLDLACDLDPRIRRTPALELVNAALVEAFNTPDARLAISIAPQEGKTTLAVVNFIVWALQQEPDLPIVLGTVGNETSGSVVVRPKS